MKPLFHKSNEEYVYFGEQKVEIPKLTIAKWKLLFETGETLPQTVVNVLSTKDSEDFVANIVVGTTLVIDEMVNMVDPLRFFLFGYLSMSCGTTKKERTSYMTRSMS